MNRRSLLVAFFASLIALAFCPATAFAASRETDPDIDPVKVDPEAESCIKGALKWLASKQNANGSWTQGSEHPTAMTGYVLIAFMAAGNLPDEGEYSLNVRNGVNYLLNAISPDGIYNPRGGHYMYGHGVATIALAELYGQTRDPRIADKLKLVVNRILRSQNRDGGWRYNPEPSDADISVTVLQVVALRAAKNAGLEVPQAALDNAVKYVGSCYHNDRTGGFTYQPRNNQPGFARTAAAIYSLQVCGQYGDPRIKKGSDFLLKSQSPAAQQQESDRQWFTYGHFYAAPAQYMIGGDTWRQWYPIVRNKLVPAARRQGDMVYWEPREGGQGVGPVYATAVYAMVLALPYHYIPLYQR